MALDRRNYRQLVDTTVELAQKVRNPKSHTKPEISLKPKPENQNSESRTRNPEP